MIEEYKRWEISHNSFAFWRDDQLIATSPDYDVDCDQDGFFVCNGEILKNVTNCPLIRAVNLDGFLKPANVHRPTRFDRVR